MNLINSETKKHGLYLGGYLIALGIILRVTELDRSGSVLWLFYICGPAVSILLFRALAGAVSLSIWRALVMALVTGLIGASLYGLYVYISNGLIDGAFLDYVRAQNVQQIRASGASEAAMQAQIDQLDFFLSPPVFAVVVWIRLQIVYAVSAALMALVYRKKLAAPVESAGEDA